jgi:nucleoside-diphosphate-sugar epimerase
VAGATGATGKFVVQQLLDKGHNVRVIARSKERMISLLNEQNADYHQDHLSVTEASILDLPSTTLEELTKDCDGKFLL